MKGATLAFAYMPHTCAAAHTPNATRQCQHPPVSLCRYSSAYARRIAMRSPLLQGTKRAGAIRVLQTAALTPVTAGPAQGDLQLDPACANSCSCQGSLTCHSSVAFQRSSFEAGRPSPRRQCAVGVHMFQRDCLQGGRQPTHSDRLSSPTMRRGRSRCFKTGVPIGRRRLISSISSCEEYNGKKR